MIVAGVVLAMAAFALEGGEYGTSDLLSLRRREARERERITALEREVDSLRRVARALRTDSATQERVAREMYGMIRPGEILYQVVPPDSGPP